MKHRISAGIIVEHQSRVLLVRHLRPGRYDFWVAPGGGVQGEEELSAAAIREVREESGLLVEAERLAYIEELIQPDLRLCKFWFVGRLLGGELNTAAPEAKAEHIVEAAWLTRQDMEGKTIFPPVVRAEYWNHRDEGFKSPKHLGLRRMEFW